MTNSNPLEQYFRHPSTHLTLPSGGKYWDQDAIEMPATGEIPVYSMTAKDEVIMKTPDALMNGSAVVDVIQSCIPSIKNAWKMPAIDTDAILIAIRIASYGEKMETSTTCPHCKEVTDIAINLGMVADNIPAALPSTTFEMNGLSIVFKPYDYDFTNKINQAQFEKQKLVANVTQSDMSDDEKIAHFTKTFKEMADHSITSVGLAIESVTLPDGTVVTDQQHIQQFFDKCDRQTYQDVRKKIVEFGSQTSVKPVRAICQHCEKEVEVPITFDQANFFE